MLNLTTKGIAVAALMWGLAIPAWAQPAPSVNAAMDQIESTTGQHFQGVPTDWSSQHLVVSAPNPASPNYNAVQQNPRYWMQVIRRARPQAAADDAAFFEASKKKKKVKKHVKVKKDWRMFTGGVFDPQTFQVIDDFPAKFTFTTGTESCSDYVIYTTEQPPSPTQATLVAFNNIYTPLCGTATGGTVPSVFWSFNTSAISTTPSHTSPVLSADGTQVAFAQGSNLILLKPGAGGGTLSAPVAPTNETIAGAAAYRACTGPCMFSIPLTNTDSHSSPFVDYAHDTLYVGDDGNKLYEISAVFKGNPALEASATVTGAAGGLASPVYDSGSGLVFVSDLTGGFLFSVSSASLSTQVQSGHLSFNGFLNDAPLVDSGSGEVYYFSSDDGQSSMTSTINCNTGSLSRGPCSGVFQFPAAFTGGATGTEEQVGLGGTGATGNPFTLYSGAFDNAFYTSGSSGNLYTCGNFGPANNIGLYQIPISSNVMGTPIVGPTLVTSNAITCTPLTEFDNAGTDLLFVGVTDHGALGTCNNKGCVMSFNITTPPISTSTTPTSSTNQGGNGGSTAFIVDNDLGNGGSQVYWLPLNNLTCTGNMGGTGGEDHGQAGSGVCAVQASQASLTE